MKLNYCAVLSIATFLVASSSVGQSKFILDDVDPIGNYNRILGGSNLKESQYPNYVTLTLANSSQTDQYGICGGVLVTKRLILTAANCLRHNNSHIYASNSIFHPDLWQAMKVDRIRAEQKCTDKRFAISPQVEFNYGFVRLERDFPIRDNQLALFPIEPVKADQKGIQVGAGLIGLNDNKPVKPGLVQTLPVSQSSCPADATASNLVCFKADCKCGNSCLGDGGGPVYVTGSNNVVVVAGIASWTRSKCKPSAESTVFTDTFSNLSELKALGRFCAVSKSGYISNPIQ